MDISAEHAVGGGDRYPVAVKGALAGMHHVDVKVAGHSISEVVESDAVDVTRPADLFRRVNLLRQGIFVSDYCRYRVGRAATVTDLHDRGGIRGGSHTKCDHGQKVLLRGKNYV